VLTVRRFKERHDRVKQRLAGIPYEFFYGIDKIDLSEETIRNEYVYNKKNSLAINQKFKPLNEGEIACSLSHRNIYQHIVDNNWDHVLIFEDDVVPDMQNMHLLKHMLDALPTNWDLLYLGYLKNESPGFNDRFKQSWYLLQSAMGLAIMPLSMVKNRLPKQYDTHLMKAGFHDCTHAYAISLNGAKKLLKAQSPVIYRADNLLSALVLKGELNAFICKPVLFNQEIDFDPKEKSYIRNT